MDTIIDPATPRPFEKKREHALLSHENCMKAVRAELGRRLREEYGTAQPLPDRLAGLLRKIEKSTSETSPNVAHNSLSVFEAASVGGSSAPGGHYAPCGRPFVG
jgi:hypothetical protein